MIQITLVYVILATFLCASASGHSFLTSPGSISTMDGCRIGGTGGFIGNCPGPCPNMNIAGDAHPSNPMAIFHRGSYHRVVWSRNNHEGGFVRWSMVPLDKMHDKEWHQKMAFHYNCWNVGRFNCNEFDFHRDCNYDRDNEAYSKMLYIPPVYPDGDYILGWTWYGGGVGFGHFGDYYDCAYVRVNGGEPLQKSYTPVFEVGGDTTHEDGCEATVDELGICWKEPCTPLRPTEKKVPTHFQNGSTPDPILSQWYGDHVTANTTSVALESLRLIDTRRDIILDADLTQIIRLNRNDEISLLAHTTGEVDYVQWYSNGKTKGADYDSPYTIAGDENGDFYPWMYPIFNRRMRITVKVVGKDGSFSWGNVELRFQETHSPGASDFSGTTWGEFQGGSGESAATGGEDKMTEPMTMIGEPMEEEAEDDEMKDSEVAVTIDQNTATQSVSSESNIGNTADGSQSESNGNESQSGSDSSFTGAASQSSGTTENSQNSSPESMIQLQESSSGSTNSFTSSLLGNTASIDSKSGVKRGRATSTASRRYSSGFNSREEADEEIDRATAEFA